MNRLLKTLSYRFPGLRKPLNIFLMVFCIGGGWALAAIDYFGYDVTALPSLVLKKDQAQIQEIPSSIKE